LKGTDAGNSGLTQPTSSASITAWDAQGKGFYSPVGVANSVFSPAQGATPSLPNPSATTIWNTIKGGQTVPLKFNVYAGTVEKTALTDISSFTQAAVSCGASDASDPVDM